MEKVRPSRPCANEKKPFVVSAKNNDFFNLPLTETQIIQLHTIFMTPAKHTIQTFDVNSGRSLIETILNSLGYYHQIGCLTIDSFEDQEAVLDIYQIIQKNAQANGLLHAIEQFFIDYNSIDFVWVELTSNLVSQMGTKYIQHMCDLLVQTSTIPVVILRYDLI